MVVTELAIHTESRGTVEASGRYSYAESSPTENPEFCAWITGKRKCYIHIWVSESFASARERRLQVGLGDQAK